MPLQMQCEENLYASKICLYIEPDIKQYEKFTFVREVTGLLQNPNEHIPELHAVLTVHLAPFPPQVP